MSPDSYPDARPFQDYRGQEALVSLLLRRHGGDPRGNLEIPDELDEAGRSYAEGEVRASLGLTGHSLPRLAEALRKDPASPEARAACAALLLKGTERVHLLEAVVHSWPELSRPRVHLAEALAPNNPREAVSQFRKALEIEPDDPQALLGLGDALCATGDRPGAAEAATRVLELTPDLPTWHGAAAVVMWKGRRHRQALSAAWQSARLSHRFRDWVFALTLPYYAQRVRTQLAIYIVVGLATWVAIGAGVAGKLSLLRTSPVLAAFVLLWLVHFASGIPARAGERRLLAAQKKGLGTEVEALLRPPGGLGDTSS